MPTQFRKLHLNLVRKQTIPPEDESTNVPNSKNAKPIQVPKFAMQPPPDNQSSKSSAKTKPKQNLTKFKK